MLALAMAEPRYQVGRCYNLSVFVHTPRSDCLLTGYPINPATSIAFNAGAVVPGAHASSPFIEVSVQGWRATALFERPHWLRSARAALNFSSETMRGLPSWTPFLRAA